MSNALPLDGSHLDIITMVETDHRAVEALMAQIEQTPPERRTELFGRLLPALVGHEVAEEQVVFPALRVASDQVEPVIRARLEEQAAAERLLQALEPLDPASPAFLPVFQELHRAVSAHAAAEEREVLPLIAELEQALDRPGLGARFEEAKRRAPTHPHPEAPQRPPGNLILGPLTGLLDRVRDAFR